MEKSLNKKPIGIAVTNLKGGVGKTTTVAGISFLLGEKGYKVLVIDTDSQCNLTSLFNQDAEKIEKSINEVMLKEENINNCIIENVEENVDLLPGSPYVASLEMKLFSQLRRASILEKAIKKLNKKYDFIICDTAPALNNMTMNVFIASDEIIIPSEADIFSMKAIDSMNDTIRAVQEIHDINILGILLTRVERISGDKIMMENSKKLAEILNTKIYNTYIRAQKNVKESRIFSTNVVKYSRENRRKGREDAGNDYEKFTEELLKDLEERYGYKK